ncbi:MAG: DegT/DnrJ/EryC1/StrS family aminotransferase [Thermoplasmatales archaeon]|nr:MAG: DegT/DnrJ/EryC1/StrS family aminotransferase [Thermoplasmatales archaeon]
MDKPAVLGGKPTFKSLLPITKPTLPKLDSLSNRYTEILSSGMITNSKYVKQFEEELQNYIKVKHALAISSCTSGLMLIIKSLKLKGEIILPSFTFSASGHALIWNNIKPKFVDIDEKTYNIDPKKVNEAIGPKTSAILGVHIFGNPCDIKALDDIARDHKIKLIFDAAHALGSEYKNKRIGRFGHAESFSCSPTKLMVTGEGGIVTSNIDELKRRIMIGRNYGDDGSYDCEFAGLNARMSELHAILGLESLNMLEKNLKNRRKFAEMYIEKLKKLPGIKFQKINSSCRTTFKDFSIYIDSKKFGLNRDELSKALAKENIMSRKYFYPPLHKQKAYSRFLKEYKNKLPVTNNISKNVLSLPLYSHMEIKDVNKVCDAIKRINGYSGFVRKKLK